MPEIYSIRYVHEHALQKIKNLFNSIRFPNNNNIPPNHSYVFSVMMTKRHVMIQRTSHVARFRSFIFNDSSIDQIATVYVRYIPQPPETEKKTKMMIVH